MQAGTYHRSHAIAVAADEEILSTSESALILAALATLAASILSFVSLQ